MALPSNISGDLTGAFIDYVFEGTEHTWINGNIQWDAEPIFTPTQVSRAFQIVNGGSDVDYDIEGLAIVEERPFGAGVGYWLTVSILSPYFEGLKEEFMSATMPETYDSGMNGPGDIEPIPPTTDLAAEIFFSWIFEAHHCECLLNTLHCAGLTLAGLCGSDKHTAAIVLGTAGGKVTGGIKADAARENGLLGGWYSWH